MTLSEMWRKDLEEAPTVEVRVYQEGRLIHRELCESEEDAALLADQWAERDGVSCEVEDLAARHQPGDVLEPERVEPLNEDHAPGPAT